MFKNNVSILPSSLTLSLTTHINLSLSLYIYFQVVHAMDRTTRVTDYRFIKEANGALTITNVMLEDDGKWQCEAENTRHYTENARPVKLVVLGKLQQQYYKFQVLNNSNNNNMDNSRII